MKILITGGNGFLGKRLGKVLKERGEIVFLASRNNKQNLLAQCLDVMPLLWMCQI